MSSLTDNHDAAKVRYIRVKHLNGQRKSSEDNITTDMIYGNHSFANNEFLKNHKYKLIDKDNSTKNPKLLTRVLILSIADTLEELEQNLSTMLSVRIPCLKNIDTATDSEVDCTAQAHAPLTSKKKFQVKESSKYCKIKIERLMEKKLVAKRGLEDEQTARNVNKKRKTASESESNFSDNENPREKGLEKKRDENEKHYLSHYGYLPLSSPATGGIISEKALHRALAEFQSFAGINVTGVLDHETVFLMSLPRCGVKDKISRIYENRSKRYALQGSKWRIKNLTYKISKYPRALDRKAVDAEIAKAFFVWSEYTDLTFTPKKSGHVHIEVRFERGEHGDGDPFDGPGGTLAHAYFPVYGGDAHFDDSEHWTINSFRGTNLFQVAAHEFGHSLGLSHSDVRSALMAPFYRGYDPNFMLDSDDIQGIQALYGLKSEAIEIGTKHQQLTTNIPPTKEEDAQLCLDSKIDTIFDSAESETYIFKGQYYWRLTNEGIVSGYPRLISESWKELPGNIDAAFTYKNGKTYFFKGSRYWRYIDKIIDGDYPKDISEGFTGIPDNIDAASIWTGNGKIYFFKGTKFWKFDPSLKPPVKSTYPKLISIWKGIPDNIDALHSHNGYTYFFKDKEYYRFNDRTFSILLILYFQGLLLIGGLVADLQIKKL
ncbi:stromelysin-3 isoform X2 [Phymastichus coffea]|uniref:stromelysin-3 isoform X2 n=1 Tax=Phymastichus coffea TaxID=108790 RepID=UPI00273CD058|nr:stromelysin-3 isoform X2 [Phymastichus coffea]